MKQNVFLKSRRAIELYESYARDLPIIDYHNHIAVSDIACNRRFENLTQLWLACDPYKHRLMRICGVEEHFITGSAEPYEKFKKFCEIFPSLAGNPVYDWSRMELSRVFGIEERPCRETAERIYAAANEMLASDEFSNNAILSRFGIEYQSPVATLLEDLSFFNGSTVAPSLRADELLAPTKEFLAALSQKTDTAIADTASYVSAVGILLDRFDKCGCRFADHALDDGFFSNDPEGKKRDLLLRLGVEYAKRGWTLLLHLGAKRKTSARLRDLAGPAGGYAAAGENFSVGAVCDLLGDMEAKGGLPDTVLFPLNMSDVPAFSVMQGSFAEDGTPSKVQLGPAWWWCDHALGIRYTLSSVASFGVLSRFIGMTTDSRSILSFVRHDYFRRLLCSFIDEQNEVGDWDLSPADAGELIQGICYQNAKNKIYRSK